MHKSDDYWFDQGLMVNLLLQQAERQESLDRLGQFLEAVTAAQCLSGGTRAAGTEVISALKSLPTTRLIQAYVVNLAKVS